MSSQTSRKANSDNEASEIRRVGDTQTRNLHQMGEAANDPSYANEKRGIKNAEARYKERIEGLTTESQIYTRKNKKSRSRINEDGQQVFVARGSKDLQMMQEAEASLQALFLAENIEYEEGDTELLITDRPIKPPFPAGIFFLALVKDVLDVLQLTLLLSLLVLVITLPVLLILAFYFYGKMSGAWWKKKLIKKLWLRFATTALIESMPLVGLIPATTILVLMTHYSETSLVKAINAGLERLH
jgi:hypothetical protein